MGQAGVFGKDKVTVWMKEILGGIGRAETQLLWESLRWHKDYHFIYMATIQRHSIAVRTVVLARSPKSLSSSHRLLLCASSSHAPFARRRRLEFGEEIRIALDFLFHLECVNWKDDSADIWI